MKQSIISRVFAAAVLAGTFLAPLAKAAEAGDWIYMDLGEVIVTGNPTDGYTYVPGALDFLHSLREDGYHLALVSNIPESWGVTCELKLASLQEFLGSRLHETVPMDWTLFDKVIVPPFDRYRKPTPFMFVAALANACPGRVLYIGENAPEISRAQEWGFATFNPEGMVNSPTHLPSLTTIAEKLGQDFSFSHPNACTYEPIIHDILLPQDQLGGIEACVVTP